MARPAGLAWSPSGAPGLWPLAVLCVGLGALYVPTLLDLLRGPWSSDQQGHGPLVMGLGIWLIWRAWPRMAALAPSPRPGLAWPLIAMASLLYVVGRSQGILSFEVGSSIAMLVGLTLLMWGPAQLRLHWFALLFLCFMVPLPGPIVDALTQPMKLAVSYVAESVLFAAGYPISRTGVTIQIGPYQLLVADACAGLHTLFTLEAMGLLYLNVVRVSSAFRNVALALLIVPISFAANVVRVIALTLITYHLGDAAGQGFLHGFAGMVLFLSALLLIIATDGLLRFGDGIRTRGAA